MKLLESLIEIINEARPNKPVSDEIYVIPTSQRINYWDKNQNTYKPFNFYSSGKKKPIFFNLIDNEEKTNRNGGKYWLFTYKNIIDGKTYSIYTDESPFEDISSVMGRIPKIKDFNDFSDGEITNFITSYQWDEKEIEIILSNEIIYNRLNNLKNEKIKSIINNFNQKRSEEYEKKSGEYQKNLQNLNKGVMNPQAKFEKNVKDIKTNFQKIGVTAPTLGYSKGSIKFVFSNKDIQGSHILISNPRQYQILSENIEKLGGKKLSNGSLEISNIELKDEEKGKYKTYKIKDRVFAYNDIRNKTLTIYIDNSIKNQFKDLLPCDNTDDNKLDTIKTDFKSSDFQKINLKTEFKGI